MSATMIFVVGAVVALLCAIFVFFTVEELRRSARETEEEERSRPGAR